MDFWNIEVDSFIVMLCHKKCKLIQFVKKQMEQLNDREYHPELMSEQIQHFQRTKQKDTSDIEYENKEADTKQLLQASRSQATATIPQSPEVLNVLRRSSRKLLGRLGWKAKLIAITTLIGCLIWISMIYGVLLGANYCSGHQVCFPFKMFGYTTKRKMIF